MVLSEYHGGAQRGGILVPKGFRGTGWKRFAKRIESFFLGKEMPAKSLVGNHRNGRVNLGIEVRDTRTIFEPITQSFGSSNPIKSAGLTSTSSRVQLDPAHLTCKFEFKWDPFPNTLRITKFVGEKRRAQWVGLKHKAWAWPN